MMIKNIVISQLKYKIWHRKHKRGIEMERLIKKIIVMVCFIISFVLCSNTMQAADIVPWSKTEDGKFVNGNGQIMEGATMKGIDVSKWNGDIDWKKVAESDVDYAIIRCGFGDDYVSQDDVYWEKNVKGCEENDIPFGVYIYSYAENVNQAKSEFAHVMRLIQGHTLNFPIYLDVEDSVQAKLPKTTLTKIINTFVEAVHNQGYEVGIYANLNWWTNYIDASIANNQTWFKWVAQYNNTGTTYQGIYQMWQCTSTGRVNGIYGDVDLNFWFGPVRTRQYNAKNVQLTTPPPSVPKKVTAPARASFKSLTKGKKKVKVKVNKVSGAKGYQIQYSTKKSFKGKKSVNITARTKTIKKLKSKKTYYFRVRAYKLNGKKKVYSKKWSKVKKVKVK